MFWLFSFDFFFIHIEKKPKPENIEIYTLKTSSDRRFKVTKFTLADIWKQGFIIRINNFGDKEKSPHSEKDIKNQVILTQILPFFEYFCSRFSCTRSGSNHFLVISINFWAIFKRIPFFSNSFRAVCNFHAVLSFRTVEVFRAVQVFRAVLNILTVSIFRADFIFRALCIFSM